MAPASFCARGSINPQKSARISHESSSYPSSSSDESDMAWRTSLGTGSVGPPMAAAALTRNLR